MGKGDQRTRRGKLNRGTYGKPRARNNKKNVIVKRTATKAK